MAVDPGNNGTGSLPFTFDYTLDQTGDPSDYITASLAIWQDICDGATVYVYDENANELALITNISIGNGDPGATLVGFVYNGGYSTSTLQIPLYFEEPYTPVTEPGGSMA